MGKESEVFFPNRGLTRIELLKENDVKINQIEEDLVKYYEKIDKHMVLLGKEKLLDENAVWNKKDLDVIDLLLGRTPSDSIHRDYLVTNQGVQVPLSDLEGKYVFIACFTVPLISGTDEAAICHAMIALSRELSAKEVACEFVLVIKGVPYSRNQEKAFKHFFSGFPENFLAIPFHDRESRKKVCGYLSRTSLPENEGVVVDPTGKIVDNFLSNVRYYGSAYYPFSEDHLLKLLQQDDLLQARLDHFSYLPPCCDDNDDFLDTGSLPPLSITELLKHEKKDCVLAKIPRVDDSQFEPLSVLDDKLVGLYLCSDGHLMEPLNQLQEQCSHKSSSFQFEIVVLPLALWDHKSACWDDVVEAFSKLNICTWWGLFLEDDKLMRSLWRISGHGRSERLILLPVGATHSGEVHADAVISGLGIHSTEKGNEMCPKVYPFTRERLYYERLSFLNQVNLLSLLNKFKNVYPCKGGLLTPVEELEGKKVLLYLNFHESPKLFNEHCDYLLKTLPKFTESDYEVVCIFMGDHFSEPLPWLRVPIVDVEDADLLTKSLFAEHLGEFRPTRSAVVVAFGEDGSVCSRDLRFDGEGAGSIFECKVSEQIFCEVTDYVDLRVVR